MLFTVDQAVKLTGRHSNLDFSLDLIKLVVTVCYSTHTYLCDTSVLPAVALQE